MNKYLALCAVLLWVPAAPAGAEQDPLQKTAFEIRRAIAQSQSRFRYTLESRSCVNQQGQVGFNPTSLDEFKRTLDGECVRLRGADLRGARLSGAKLRGADLTSASLSDADLRGADLTGSTMFTTNLSRADLTGARVNDIDMNGSTARNTVFRRAQITLTNMKGSDMRGADFREANLQASDLRFTDFTDCDFHAAVFDGFSRLPFSEQSAILRGMIKIK